MFIYPFRVVLSFLLNKFSKVKILGKMRIFFFSRYCHVTFPPKSQKFTFHLARSCFSASLPLLTHRYSSQYVRIVQYCSFYRMSSILLSFSNFFISRSSIFFFSNMPAHFWPHFLAPHSCFKYTLIYKYTKHVLYSEYSNLDIWDACGSVDSCSWHLVSFCDLWL